MYLYNACHDLLLPLQDFEFLKGIRQVLTISNYDGESGDFAVHIPHILHDPNSFLCNYVRSLKKYSRW